MLLERVDSETREKINTLSRLYKQHGGEIPLDIELMQDCLVKLIDKDIEVVWRNLKKTGAGYVWPQKGGFRITLNDNDCLNNQRFTFCHEAGHILYCFDYIKELPCQKSDRLSSIFCRNAEIEDICDEISMVLLCPPVLVEKFLKEEFWRLPCQLELFRKKQRLPETARLRIMANDIFGVPLRRLIWHIRKIRSFDKRNNAVSKRRLFDAQLSS